MKSKLDPSKVKKFYLYRYLYHPDAVYGTLVYQFPLAQTLELPWKQNQRSISCIPAGQYDCFMQFHVRTDSSKYPCPEITVKGRTNIEMHIGNQVADSKGCILIGHYNETEEIRNSTFALNRMIGVLNGDQTFILVIKDCIGYESQIKTLKLAPRLKQTYIPELVMAKMEYDPAAPKVTFTFKEKMTILWWKSKPVISKILSLAGKALIPFSPIAAGIATIVGKGVESMKGNKAVEKEATVKMWEKIIKWIVDILSKIFKKRSKK